MFIIAFTGESRREGSTEEPSAAEAEADNSDIAKEQPDKEHKYVCIDIHKN